MTKRTITVAGERLDDLEAALDCYDIAFEECGCVTMTGSPPPELRHVLERALKTIESEVVATHPESRLDDAELQPMRLLFLCIGAAYNQLR